MLNVRKFFRGAFLFGLPTACVALGIFGAVHYRHRTGPATVSENVPSSTAGGREDSLGACLDENAAESSDEPANTSLDEDSAPSPAVSEGSVQAAEKRSPVDHLEEPLLDPASRTVVFHVGSLDARPANAVSSLQQHEYQVLVHDAPVVSVPASEIATQFPQTIAGGQRIVMHLPALPAEPLLFRMVTTPLTAAWGGSLPSASVRPRLRVLFNGRRIWHRSLAPSGHVVRALVPAGYVEGYDNTLSVINEGESPIVTDALWLELAGDVPARELLFGVVDHHTLPDYAKRVVARWPERAVPECCMTGVSSLAHLSVPVSRYREALTRSVPTRLKGTLLWHYRTIKLDFGRQEEVALGLAEFTAGWFFHGGTGLAVSDTVGTARLFCARTGRPYPASVMLRTLAQLFSNGRARELPLNVLPAERHADALGPVYWVATQPSPDTAAIFVSGTRFGGGDHLVRLMLRVPWSGETMIEETTGIFPEHFQVRKPVSRGTFKEGVRSDSATDDYDAYRKTSKTHCSLDPDGKNGALFTTVVPLRGVALIRLRRESPAWPAACVVGKRPGGGRKKVGDDINDIKLARVARARACGVLPRVTLAPAPGLLVSQSAEYEAWVDDATPGTVGDISHVVPHSSDSLFFKVAYRDPPLSAVEGVVLNLRAFNRPLANRRLSFWIRPHVDGETYERVRLGLQVAESVTHVILRSDQWQRVTWQLPASGLRGMPFLVFFTRCGDPMFQAGGEMTYELNGMSLEDVGNGTDRYVRQQRFSAQKKMGVVLLGRPGDEVIYGTAFNFAGVVHDVEAMWPADAGRCEWTYSAPSQRLHVRGLHFPRSFSSSAAEQAKRYLAAEELASCRERGLTPVVLLVHLDD
ncbi:MAG: hypothetical protein K9N51_05305 [Candidatus Pacebacteria bacterium]|nr:hypothetical protein [Candidatus Paceibacterota bacterium]